MLPSSSPRRSISTASTAAAPLAPNCPLCEEPRRAWICVSCNTHELARRRAQAQSAFDARQRVEELFQLETKASIEQGEKKAARQRLRLKVERMKQLVADEQAQLQRLESSIAERRVAKADRMKRLSDANAALKQFQNDYDISPDELKKLQQTVAAGAPSSSSTALSSSLSSLSRRLQCNPIFTQNLSRFLAGLQAKLAKYRLRLVEEVLHLYVIKRKSTHSCTIVGLELMDDPDAMFEAASNPHFHFQGEGISKPPLPPGTDPEVVAAALGYVVQVLHMMSCYLGIRLPYAIKFHGSHSYVLFNDEENTRYFLTLLDNTNPNHFRRAITLLNHNIQYCCERMNVNNGATSTSGHKFHSNSNQHPDALNALNLTPLHLLPNMLKLIECIFLHLKQQSTDQNFEHEQRMQLFVSAQKSRIPPPLQSIQQRTQQEPQQPSQPFSVDYPYLSTPASLPYMLDASPTSASDADTSSAHSSLPTSNPTLERLESPPFYTDMHQSTIKGKLAAMSSAVESPLPSPVSKSEPAPFMTPASIPEHRSMEHSDLLTPSQFFRLPPNGYLSTEEPRESVMWERPNQQQHPISSLQSPSSHPSPHSRNPIKPPQTQSASMAPLSSPSSLFAAARPLLSTTSPTSAMTTLSETAVAAASNMAQMFQQLPPFFGASSDAASHTHQASSSSSSASFSRQQHNCTANGVVSYPTEEDAEYDFIDTVVDETELRGPHVQRQQIRKHSK